ncbi:MAG TPA: M67 family metallopeptidase [Nostocaceae cyanobacterium]|nr:M67 family metallopeptidase [Nostocaceae cyanobacterium]
MFTLQLQKHRKLIQLQPEHLKIITTHAENTYPQECCGVILGYVNTERKIVVEVIPTANAWNRENCRESDFDHSTKDRYAIAPPELLKIQKAARDRNLCIIGIYHSHPDHPAIPSECDRLYAWPEYSYIIVSVEHGQTSNIKSWTLDHHHQFQPEPLIKSEL